jgi:glycosyltransferase involved in cell wall biosynthesis
VIRAFNEEEHIGRLLTGILRQTMENIEIVLVDSGSTDSTVSIASRFPVKIVKIPPEEFTFGRALNRGIEVSRGEFIVIISAHCYPVYPDWLELLIEPFQNQLVAAVYGKQRGGDSNHFSEHQFFRTYFPDISQLDQGQPYTHNANASIRRSLWELNPYNENLTGLEDLAWSSWAKDQGFKIAYVAGAEIIHTHNETYRQVYNRYNREAVALRQILPESQFGLCDMLSLFLQKTISDWVQAYRSRILYSEFLNVLRFRWMQYYGTYRGYSYSGKVNHELHQQFYYPPHLLTEKIPEKRAVQPIQYQENNQDGNHG